MGGKWKIEIIYYIAFRDIHRFGELRRHIGDITESSLIKQLRELEADGFITRYDYKEVPPRVEYNLTDLGTMMRNMKSGDMRIFQSCHQNGITKLQKQPESSSEF